MDRTAPIAPILVQVGANALETQGFCFYRTSTTARSFGICRSLPKNSLPNYPQCSGLITGASIIVRGALVASQGKDKKLGVVADE